VPRSAFPRRGPGEPVPTVGLVSIGQSPRDDVRPEMAGLLPAGTQIIERGALDDITPRELGLMAPAAGDTVLVTRLKSGAEVRLAEADLGPFLLRAADGLREKGADLVAVLCTGALDGIGWPGPVLLPGPIVRGLAAAMTTSGSRLAVVVPAADQREDARAEWASLTGCVRVLAASPYRGPEEIAAAAEVLADWSPDLTVLDCLGFDRSAQRLVRDAVHAPVLLPRMVLAGAIAALL
jgi:protein AroM